MPSPRRIWSEMVGREPSTGMLGADVSEEAAGCVVVEGLVGVSDVLFLADGVGLPSLCPPPPKGLYFFLGGTYFSSCCTSLTSTRWLLSTFMISRGARPCRIMARWPAFAGSSERYRGPSSTENPSAQK